MQTTQPTGERPAEGLTDDQLHGRACWHSGPHDGPLQPDGHVYSAPEEAGALLGWAVVVCGLHSGQSHRSTP
ncbi:hypothetical protein [Kitasatospora sp. NBC_01539]|uniref:hypothetical protein n=1 Tax=Kitasatospora sp. NBC_01539 TaxID=2903577 RepID=UPI0038601328